MSKFVCSECGSTDLAYRKFIKCITPVEIKEDGTIVYLSSVIDEDNTLGVECRFVCADCGHTIYHRGNPLETEGDLLYFLDLTNEERKQQNDDYFARIQDELNYKEQQRQEFEASICEIPEDQ